MKRSLDFALPNVKLESLTLRNHRMTFSHSSKESLRPLTQRDKVDVEFSHSSKESLRPLTLRDKVDVEELRLLGG